MMALCILLPVATYGQATVYVSRFWHNHQPIYWPEWNGNGGQTERIQYAWDSIVLKSGQTYDTGEGHPDNNLTDIFSKSDRVQAYQSGPKNSLALLSSQAGYAMSYSGSLIDNVRNLGGNNQLGYSSAWWNGNREAHGWSTPSGGTRLDLVGFTYHHSLAPVLPKSVLRKELQTFKQAWWKAWDGNSDLSDHSKGFFPTEMAFSMDMVDVLADEGYEWVIVASHHLSRTCPTYNDYADPEGTFQIKSSPPNRADQLGPSPSTGWWFAEPNPGQAAWNVSPFSYRLHRTRYVDPETGAEQSIIVVPSDDVLSYKAGYSGAEIGMVSGNIAPYSSDPNDPVIVLPSTDGDNAWGGGSSSWNESTPSFFGACESAGYQTTTIQDMIDAKPPAVDDYIHVEDGAWIFPVDDYGSPYYLKWVEPPLNGDNPSSCYSNTIVDLETPGFALKFWSWAVVMTGANWLETAEQIWTDNGGSVEAWKIQAPYDWDGSWTSPNDVELAWHIYLGGLDSGFNYYGGLGNDDEVKPSLATRRAIEKIETYINANISDDRTPPTVFRPQRFPWNPGWYTFGWFNRIPGVDERFLKKMPSEFYVWTHIYDVSDVSSVNLKVRIDSDGTNTLANNQNETYAGGGDVGAWVTVPMTMRELPNTRSNLNELADNGDIDYFITPPYLADYYFAKIDDSSVSGFRGKLLDYYIEAVDTRGNTNKTDIQHVYVVDDGEQPGSSVSFSDDPSDCAPITVTYNAGGGVLSGVDPVYLEISFDDGSSWDGYAMTNTSSNVWSYARSAPDNAPSATVWFRNATTNTIDNRSGLNWSTSIRDCDAPVGPGSITFSNAPACDPVMITYHPNDGVLKDAEQIYAHIGFNDWSIMIEPDVAMSKTAANSWQYSIVPPENATQIDMVFNDGGAIWDNRSGEDWSTNVTGCDEGDVPPGIMITNPSQESVTITSRTAAVTLRGTAGDSVTGYLSWTNRQTGGSGTFSNAMYWVVTNLSLQAGSNTIIVSGPTAGGTTTNAWDNAGQSAYAESWISGDNGGAGWGGGWDLMGAENAGHFIADAVSHSNLNISSPAFGLYANSDALSQAVRPLVSPLSSGQTLRVAFENNWINTSNSVGMALMNNNADGLFEFYFYGGEDHYRISDCNGIWDSGIPWTADGMDIAFTLTGGTNYAVTIGSSNYTGSLISRDDMQISRVRFWNYSAGPDTAYNAYFNDLYVTSENDGDRTSDSVFINLINPDLYMPDWWQSQYFGCATCAVADVDSDGDGFLNLQEYWLGTNPTNILSTFEISTAEVGEATYYTIHWLSVGGKAYDIQYTDHLGEDPFQHVITISEDSVADGVMTNRVFQDTVTTPSTNGFRAYRVRLHQ
jgi:hypothetical protein